MGLPIIDKRIVYWKVELYGNDTWTEIMQDSVASITITYEVNKPPMATIEIISVNYIEDVFYVGTPIDIYMGFDPITMPHMLHGKIINLPKGSAKDVLAYTVEVQGGVPSLYTEEKNRIYGRFLKQNIISLIAIENGMLADVYISDINPFTKSSIPIQRQKTDYAFLVECAQRWECSFWFSYDELTGLTTLHFYDKNVASQQGDILKKFNLGDTGTSYLLGYKSFNTINNVQQVKWGFDKKRNGSPGSSSFSETGSTEKPDDWVISFRGQRWELKKKWIDKAKINPKWWYAYAQDFKNKFFNDPETTVRTYFRLCPTESKNHQDTYNNEPIDLTVDLNIGDPYLRPPRSAFLISGTPDPKAVSAHLPQFIYEGETEISALFRMSKVTTTLNAGKLSTQLKLTRDIAGRI